MIRKLKIIFINICLFLFPINIYAVMTDINISGPTEVLVGETIQLQAKYTISNDMVTENNSTSPSEEDVTNKTNWSVNQANTTGAEENNLKIATIDNNGILTGVNPGKVTVSAEYSGTKKTYEITVKANENTNSSNESESSNNDDEDSNKTVEKQMSPNTASPGSIVALSLGAILVIGATYVILSKRKPE